MASAHRLRTKTSDITDFFSRTSSSSKPRPSEADETGPSSDTFLSEPELPVRRRSTKIPFLGRQRKKSTQSDASNISVGPSNALSDSEMLASNKDIKPKPRSSPEVPTMPSLDDPSERPLPALPQKHSPAQSLGSRLAAHLAPSRTKFINLSPRKPPRPPTNERFPPAIPPSRTASADSNSSENRSTTPRPNQPTITVSLPPDNLEGYEGMFTLPNSGPSDAEDSPPTPTPLDFPTQPPSSDAQSRSREGNITVKRRGSRATAEDRSPSRSSRISRKHVGSAFKHSEVDSTDAEDSEAVMSDSPQPSAPMSGPTGIAEKRRTLATMPYNFLEKATQPRSIMKQASDRLPRPPVFPPPPPPTHPPSSALPGIPTADSRKPNGNASQSSGLSSRRPRAQTLSAIAPSITISPATSSLSTLPSRRVTKSTGESTSPAAALAKRVSEESAGKENLDMSTDQLRQALALRNQQFDELASYLLKITEAHVAEKNALLKKIANLEQEATRRENEIKGLTWLVTNNPRPGSSGTTSKSESEPAKSKQQILRSSPAEDSGAESPQTTSGAEESIWASGGESSGGDSLRIKRNHPLMSSLYRASTKTRPEAAASIIPPSSTNRSSVSSFGTSSSSSTSSLSLNPTVTPATTVVSLSAIPESVTAASTTPETRTQDPVVAAAILAAENQREKHERRAKRASNRISASSLPTPSPSASYSANLKRGRPPSIAQVLAQSPKMEHGRDKPRSYGTSGSTSS